jgi:hypothetical protein
MLKPEYHKYFITKTEYFEFGADYFKEHVCSNQVLQRTIVKEGNLEQPVKKRRLI